MQKLEILGLASATRMLSPPEQDGLTSDCWGGWHRDRSFL